MFVDVVVTVWSGTANGDLCVVGEAQSPAFAENPGCEVVLIRLSGIRRFDGGEDAEPSGTGVLTCCDAVVTGVELFAVPIPVLGKEAGSVLCGVAAPGGTETCERFVTGFPPASPRRAGSSAGGSPDRDAAPGRRTGRTGNDGRHFATRDHPPCFIGDGPGVPRTWNLFLDGPLAPIGKEGSD